MGASAPKTGVLFTEVCSPESCPRNLFRMFIPIIPNRYYSKLSLVHYAIALQAGSIGLSWNSNGIAYYRYDGFEGFQCFFWEPFEGFEGKPSNPSKTSNPSKLIKQLYLVCIIINYTIYLKIDKFLSQEQLHYQSRMPTVLYSIIWQYVVMVFVMNYSLQVLANIPANKIPRTKLLDPIVLPAPTRSAPMWAC